MIRVELLSAMAAMPPEKHAFIFTDSERVDQISGELYVSDFLRFEEVGFFGQHSSSLHDQLDDFIGDGQNGDPLTQVFSDEDALREYLREHADVGVNCILLCDEEKYISIGESLVTSINS